MTPNILHIQQLANVMTHRSLTCKSAKTSTETRRAIAVRFDIALFDHAKTRPQLTELLAVIHNARLGINVTGFVARSCRHYSYCQGPSDTPSGSCSNAAQQP